MKITRMLAGLLCLVMVVCSLPMMATARVSNDLYNTMGKLMGYESARPVENDPTWLGMNFDFKNSFSQTEGITLPVGASYDNTNGLTFPSGATATWRYFPVGTTQWSPLALGAYTSRFKLEENGIVEYQACACYQHARSYIQIFNDSVVVWTSKDNATLGTDSSDRATVPLLNPYTPGTDWNDLLVVANGGAGSSANGYSVYMKKASDEQFTKVASTNSYRGGGSWKSTGLTISGQNCHISDAVMLKGDETELVSQTKIESVLGGPVAASYAFDFDGSFDFNNWKRSGNGALNSPSGVTYSDENGLDMTGNAQTGTDTNGNPIYGTWNFYAFPGWSPFSAEPPWGTYTPQAVYLKLKGSVNVQLRDPSNGTRFYQDFAANKEIYAGGATVAENYNIVADDGWMEYLIVPNATTPSGGFTIYAKGETATAGMWEKALVTTNYRSGGSSTTGISFYGKGGYVKSVRTYRLAMAEDEILPEDSYLCYVNEQMDQAPGYSNLSDTGVVYGDGYATLPTTVENGTLTYHLTDAEIPVGGYTEFKVRSNGQFDASIYDGTTAVVLNMYKDYGAITGGTGYVGNSSCSWRIWRIVRTESGYSVYSRAEGDSGWLVHSTNASDKSAEGSGVKLVFFPHANGTDVGSGQLDYLKIFGPDNGKVITITDGAGTCEYLGEGTPKNLNCISAVVKADNTQKRTLIFAAYGANKNMVDAQVTHIPAGKESVVVRFNALQKSKEIYGVKAFMWDLNTMNRITEANTTEGNKSDIAVVDGWRLTGNATLENGKLSLKSTNGIESYGEYPVELGERYDVSWDMAIDSYGSNEKLQIYNGSTLLQLVFRQDGIQYVSSGGNVEIPWIINRQSHNYRVIGNESSALLFIDGYFVSNLSSLPANTGKPRIKFWNRGNSDMRIRNVLLETYSASNVPVQGFCDEFENGSLDGWSNPKTIFSITKADGTKEEFGKQWVNSQDGTLMVEDYHLAQSPNTCVTVSEKTIPETGDDFLLQTRVKFPHYGTETNMVIEVDGKKLALDIREKFLSVAATSGYSVEGSDEIRLDNENFHIITIESYNKKQNAKIYLDGILVQETPLATITTTANRIYFRTNGGWFLPAQVQVDYMKYTPKYYGIELSSPSNGATYRVGNAISLNASQSANFELNGTVVASGTSASLTNLPAGTYELIAKSGNKTSETVRFSVVGNTSATVTATQSGNTISASLSSLSGFGGVARVDYLLSGKKVATATSGSYSATINNVTHENHMLEAVAYNSAGVEMARFSKEMPAVVSGSTNAYANEVNYTASGSGVVTVKNGTHLLQMTHSPSGVTYKTKAGDKTYHQGTGRFKVVTDGPYAEVYRNGQFVFSFVMPQTAEVGTSFTGSIENSSVVVPAERMSWFSENNVNVQNAVYELANLDYNHNLDFVASPSDEVHLTLNDGYYRNDITLADGKIFVWSADRNNSVPVKTEVATMEAGDVYYRVETAAGMSRLYANGSWITTFRNGNVAGRKGTLAVNVTGGDGLSYLGVNSNADLYYYEDTFDGSGEFSALDYWSSKDAGLSVSGGNLVINASGKENAVVSLNLAAGEVDLSAKLKVTGFDSSKDGGVYLMVNNPTTGTFTKAGYYKNKWGTTKRYEIVDNSASEQKSTASGSLSANATVTLAVKVRETADGREKITLYVDGAEKTSLTGEFGHRGKVGFVLSNCNVSVEEVSYRGDAKPMLAVNDNPIAGGINTLEMIETDTKTYMVNAGGGYTSTDGGKTWESFTPTPGAGLSATHSIGMSANMVQLQNGWVLAINKNSPSGWWDEFGQRRSVHNTWISEDNGMNWSKRGNIGGQAFEDAVQGRDATVNRISQGPSGRIYFMAGEGNSEDYGDAILWMSDNNGLSWFRNEQRFSALVTGYVIAEAVTVETTKDTRMYFRSEGGQLCYYKSNDRGITFDMVRHTTPFISSMTCFGVEADPADPDTLYMAWGYDNINLFARAQFPRTRWALAKSTDGGDTWEMIGTAHENNSVSHNMMNLSINVGKEHIYLNAFSSDTFGKTQPWTSRIVSFPKDKQRTSVRLEQLHTMYPTQIENTVVLPKDKEALVLTINPASGSALLNGQWISGGAEGEYVALDILKTFVGANAASNGDGGIALTLGSANIQLSADAVKTVNGKQYVNLYVAAEKLNMVVTDEDGILILSKTDSWTKRQKNALRFATDLFGNQV